MPTPYYERDGLVIYHGDCLELLPELPRHSVDLLITDPPWGVKWESGHRRVGFGVMTGDDSAAVGLAGIRATLLCLKQQRHLYVFGRWDLSQLPVGKPVELIWDKALFNSGRLDCVWGNQHENIQFAVYCPSPAKRRDGGGNLAARLRRGSVLRYARPNAIAVRHPTEKPVGLIRELVESSSRIGELVLDPFMGSGSTLVAAQREERRAIGIESEERWCEMAAKRLDGGDGST